MKKAKRYAVKPKGRPDTYWNHRNRQYDDKKQYSTDVHTTDDEGYARGKMSEDAARVNPSTNEPAEMPVPVEVVEIETTETKK